ncbi:retrovirus-related Pol polyprotein from transposon 412 [Trichonephila clavipes]|nr:retrovirus-related Pol polyprotein from transposon 412 [Trichonephila clavipes]
MAQHQNQNRRSITCWECGESGQLRSNCPRTNKKDRSTKCWGETRHLRTALEISRGKWRRPFKKILPGEQQILQENRKEIWHNKSSKPPSISLLDRWSDGSVRKGQLADSEIKSIVEFKEFSDEKPNWQDNALFHPTMKRYWTLWNSLNLRNGVLYRKWESDDGKAFRWQLILPKTRVSTVLNELHGSPTGGNFGFMKILQKPTSEIIRWQQQHPGCHYLSLKPILYPNKRHRLLQRSYFNIGPEGKGFLYNCTPIKGETSILQFTRLCEIFGIDKTWTTALHLQPDGMVEWFNRTILKNLSSMVSSNQQDWDKKLPFFLLAYRSAVHETTGYSSAQMLFGYDLRLPAGLLFRRPPDAPLPPEEYVEKLQARTEEMNLWLGIESAWLQRR